MLICSPWTTGGYIDSNVYDHTSMLQFLAAWTGVKPDNVTSWRSSVVGNLTAAFDFENPNFTIPANVPTLSQTWALTQLTGGSTTPPKARSQMPAQEPGTRPHRPSNLQPFAVYPTAYLAATPTPVTVLPSAAGSYVWNAASTSSKYSFSVYGPDGFLATFTGAVVPATQTTGQIPSVSAAPDAATATVTLTLANAGSTAISYTLTANDYEGTHPDGHRQRRRFDHRHLADRSLRLLRRDHHRQHLRQLHPPLRGPPVLSAKAPGALAPQATSSRSSDSPSATGYRRRSRGNARRLYGQLPGLAAGAGGSVRDRDRRFPWLPGGSRGGAAGCAPEAARRWPSRPGRRSTPRSSGVLVKAGLVPPVEPGRPGGPTIHQARGRSGRWRGITGATLQVEPACPA